jgi:hypothetical protein
MSDPKSVELVMQLVSEQASDVHSKNGKVAYDQADHDNGSHENGHGTRIGLIRQAVAKQSGRFDLRAIGDRVRSAGLHMANPMVGKNLQWLEKKGELRIVKRGAPGKAPNQYEKTENFKSEP